MYVCLCNALTDRQLRQHLARGVRSVSMLYRACGTEPQCGKCVPLVRQMLREDAGDAKTSRQCGGEEGMPATSPASQPQGAANCGDQLCGAILPLSSISMQS
jgi:bacterioferritin-associated ferredoxin